MGTADARRAPAWLNVSGTLVLAAFAGAWELIVRAEVGNIRFLPAPSAIIRAAGTALSDGDLAGRVAHTVWVTLLGWVIASLIGFILGLALGLSRTVYRYSMTSFEVTRAIPPITFVPVALLAFGFSLRMELVLVVFGGVWPVLINTTGGVHSVAPELHDVATMLRLGRGARIRKILLPAAMPSVLVGLRLSLSLCLVLAVVAEMVGNPEGIGNGLMAARHALQPDLMFVYVIAAGLLGIVLNAVFGLAVRVLLPGVDTIGEERR